MIRVLKMEAANKKYPAFMKSYFPPSCSKSMKIPLPVTAFIKDVIPDKVFLRDIFGKHWGVEVTKSEDELHFQDGWVTFVKENNLEFGDILVFQYLGTHEIDYKVMRRNASKREILQAFDFGVANGVEGMDLENDNISENLADGSGENPSLHGEDPENERFGGGESERRSDINGTNASNIAETVSHENKAQAEAITMGKEAASPVTEKKDCPYPRTGYVNGNPYFMATFRESRGTIYVPSEVLLDNNIKLRKTLNLYDPNGQMWSTKVRAWKDGRVWLSGRWRAFCRRNNLHEGDWFICEFVRGRGRRGTYLQVHTLPLQSSPPKDKLAQGQELVVQEDEREPMDDPSPTEEQRAIIVEPYI